MPRFRNNAFLLAGALLVGLLYLGPQFFVERKLKQSDQLYLPLQYVTRNEEVKAEMARGREIFDGHFPPAELSFTPDKKTGVFPFVPHIFLALALVLSQGNVSWAYLGSIFVFSSLVFLCFYYLGRVLWESRGWAFFIGFLGALTPLARFFSDLYNHNPLEKFMNLAVKNFIPWVNTALDRLFLDKINDPLVTYVFYLPALALFLYFWQKPNYKKAVLTGLMIGLMLYVYFHYSVFLVIFSGLALVFSWFNRSSHPARFKGMIILIGVVAVMSLPYLDNYFSFVNLPSYGDYIHRLGLEEGRHFRWNVWRDYLAYLVFIGLIWRFIGKKNKDRAQWYYLSFAAIFIAWNIQLITGYVPEPNHWWYTFSPLLFIMALDLAYNFLARPNSRYLIIILFLLGSLLVAKKVVNAVAFIEPGEVISQKYSFNKDLLASWDWINKNLTAEPKIVSDSLLTTLYLNVYTSARPYVPNWLNTVESNQAIEDRFLLANKIFKVKDDILLKRLQPAGGRNCADLVQIFNLDKKECADFYTRINLTEATFQLYGIYYSRPRSYKLYSTTARDSRPGDDVSPDKIGELADRYQAVRVEWSNLESNYVYYGKWEKQFSQLDFSRNKFLKLVYENDAVKIYKILSSASR